MKISLCILRNWLKPYHPELHTLRICDKQKCSDDCIQIEEVRLFNHNDTSDRTTLFIGREFDFFETDSQRVVCHYTESNLILETTDMFSVFNEILNAFSFYSNWGRQLGQMIERQCTLTELLDISIPIIKNPVFVLDSSDTIIAFSSKYQNEFVDQTWNRLMIQKYTSPEQAFAFHNRENSYFNNRYQEPFLIPAGLFPRNSYSQNLFLAQDWCGICAMIEYEHPFDTGQMHLFKILCDYVQIWINKQSNNALLSMDETLLSDLVHGRLDMTDSFSRKLAACGWRSDDSLVLITARPISTNYSTQSYLSRIFENHSEFIRSVTVNQDIVLLYNQTHLDETSFYHFLKPWFLKGSYCCGISYSFSGVKNIPVFYEQTQIALKYGVPAPGSMHHIKTHAIKWYIETLQKNAAMSPIHPALIQLQQYDKKHNSDYVNTLFTFLRNERNIKLTSEELKIHRNTLCQRIARLENHFNIRLDDPDERLYLLLSCHTMMPTEA